VSPVSPASPDRLRGKVVIVGLSAPGIEDVEITPVSSTFLGPEVHATVIDDFLRGDFLDEWPRPGRREHLPSALVAVLVAVVAIVAQSALISGVASFAVLLGYGTLVTAVYRAGTVMPLFGPTLAASLAFGAASVHRYLTEGRQRRAIRRMFSHYLAPAVVEQLQLHPEKLRLGGERRTMTVFFSDIEGFTTVSESLEPEALVSFLNDYLTRCTDVILASGGVIDKYEGDAIIAFWNAPLDVPEHAARACGAALACQAACAAFRAECRERGLPPIAMRVGINTGPMVVGNMGSARRFDYTVMGDAVNLASRLEGANKVFGTYSMVSDATRQACGAAGLVFRELGRLRVKGKTVPITVHELVAGPVAPAVAPAWIATFEAALRAFYGGRFEEAAGGFRATLAVRPDDPPSHRYLDRIAELQETPPAPDFDGVLILTAK
jgi:adenylate cyclase